MLALRTATTVAIFTLFASLAEAHPGHGTTEPSGLLHFVSEPDHVLVALLWVAAAAVAFALLIRRRRRA